MQFRFPLFILVLFYVALTALRDFRDNFSREIWDAVGYQGNARFLHYQNFLLRFLFC